MSQQIKAIIVHEPFGEFKFGYVDKPTPKPNELLVRNKAVAINPIDWKMQKYNILVEGYPIVLGCDGAGVVESVGSEVTKFKPGDAVFTYPRFGERNGYGTFAEYTLYDENLAFKKPENLSFEEASTISVGLLTAAHGLYLGLKLPLPSKQHKYAEPEYILIWGGASSVGVYAIQLARLSGLTVIATASAHNTEYLKSLGAEHVIDYKSSNAVSQIQALTKNKLKYAFDVISPETATLAAETLSDGGKIAWATGELKLKSDKVEAFKVLLGTAYKVPDLYKATIDLKEELEPLIHNGSIKNNTVQLVSGGLETGVLEALKLNEKGVSGKKLVVTIEN
ncbi:14067_t:CDS:2 [Ambispora leptoticha]|uniref:14067_t:CDS:1 n=1 Tax=Ambispora leptoticha TaxID=144679 RepID=A0A9N9DQI0_9GLOM|nr:14067_t:CDS:2 [Ambispora leptoticha]